MNNLSENQKKILEFIKERNSTGVPPSVREIGQAVGLSSTSSVQSNLVALEKKGYISRDPLLKRSIRITGQNENIHQIPHKILKNTCPIREQLQKTNLFLLFTSVVKV